jgi:hypothetical protein
MTPLAIVFPVSHSLKEYALAAPKSSFPWRPPLAPFT